MFYSEAGVFVDYTRPILVGDGYIQAFATSPQGDTSVVVECATTVTAGIEAPSILPSYLYYESYEYFLDSVNIVSYIPGATIHYTLDNSLPTIASPIYEGKFALGKKPFVVRAIAAMPGKPPSLSTSQRYNPFAAPWSTSVTYDSIFDARDGQTYRVVTMGDRTWMAQNLNFLPTSNPNSSGTRTLVGGVAYTWSSIQLQGSAQICPDGWSVPAKADFDGLRNWVLAQNGITADNALLALSATNSSGATDRFGFRIFPVGDASQSIAPTSFWSHEIADSSDAYVLAAYSTLVVSTAQLPNSTMSSDGSGFIQPYQEELFYQAINMRRQVRCVKN